MARRAANRTRVSTESLETMGAPALASLLVDHAKVDLVLRRKLQLLLASKEGSASRRSQGRQTLQRLICG
jgi:hypothetical protein